MPTGSQATRSTSPLHNYPAYFTYLAFSPKLEMQFPLAILALGGAAAAKAIPRDDEPAIVAVPDAPGTPDVGTEAITHLYICINQDFTGACTNLEVNTGVCCELFLYQEAALEDG